MPWIWGCLLGSRCWLIQKVVLRNICLCQQKPTIYGPGSRKLLSEAEEMGPVLHGGEIFGKTISGDHLGRQKIYLINWSSWVSNFEAKCGNMSCLLLAVFNKIPQERYRFRQESPWVQTEFKNRERKSLKYSITYRVGKIKLFLTKSKIPGRSKNPPNS